MLSLLQETADQPSLAQSHRVAACNALCGFIHVCLRSANAGLRTLVAANQVTDNLLGIYLNRYETFKSSTTKQILTSLVGLLSNSPSNVQISGHRLTATRKLLEILVQSKDHVKAKPALLALSFLISKSIIKPRVVVAAFQNIHYPVATELNLLALERFLSTILKWVSFSDVAATAGGFIPLFLRRLEDDGDARDFSEGIIWVQPLVRFASMTPEKLITIKHYLLPGLFRLDVRHLLQYLQQLGLEERIGLREGPPRELQESFGSFTVPLRPLNLDILLSSSLQVGKEQGLIDFSGTSYLFSGSDKVNHT